MKKSIPFNMRMDKATLSKLDEICQYGKSNRSETIRALIETVYGKHLRRLKEENMRDVRSDEPVPGKPD